MAAALQRALQELHIKKGLRWQELYQLPPLAIAMGVVMAMAMTMVVVMATALAMVTAMVRSQICDTYTFCLQRDRRHRSVTPIRVRMEHL